MSNFLYLYLRLDYLINTQINSFSQIYVRVGVFLETKFLSEENLAKWMKERFIKYLTF